MNPLILLSGSPPVSGGEPVTNLVSNGDFSTLDCTGWDLDALTCNASTGSAVLVTDPYGSMGQGNVLSSSTTYNFSLNILSSSATDWHITGGGTDYNIPSGTTGLVTGTFSTGSSSTYFSIQAWGGSSGATITIDNIVVWQ